MYSTGVGLVLKGFEYMHQHPEQYMQEDSEIESEKSKEIVAEPSLMDRISGWFTEDNVV